MLAAGSSARCDECAHDPQRSMFTTYHRLGRPTSQIFRFDLFAVYSDDGQDTRPEDDISGKDTSPSPAEVHLDQLRYDS